MNRRNRNEPAVDSIRTWRYWPLLLLPALFVGGFEYFRHSLMHELPLLPGNLLAAGVAVLGSFFYYLFLFRMINRLSEKLHQQRARDEMNQVRARIASELHDSIAQTLFFTNIQLKKIEEALEKSELDRANDEIRSLQEAVGNAYSEVRQVIRDLNVAEQKLKAGLPSIRQRILEFRRQTGIVTRFSLPEELELSQAADELLLSTIQECLWNIRKHARAQHVEIRLEPTSTGIELTVIDDGQGFDPSQSRNGFGIAQLRWRIEQQGGQLHIQSAPRQGTKVHVFLPHE